MIASSYAVIWCNPAQQLSAGQSVVLQATTTEPLKVYLLSTTSVDFANWMSANANSSSLPYEPELNYTYGSFAALQAYLASNPSLVMNELNVSPGSSFVFSYEVAPAHPTLMLVSNAESHYVAMTYDYQVVNYVPTPATLRAQALYLFVSGLALALAWAFLRFRKGGGEISFEKSRRGAASPAEGPQTEMKDLAGLVAATSDRWYGFLKRRQLYDKVGDAAWVFVLSTYLTLIVTFSALNLFVRNYTLGFDLSVAVGLLCALGVFVIEARRGYRYGELLTLAEQLKKGGEPDNLLEQGLVLLDELLVALPEIKRQTVRDAWRLGIIVFVVAAFSNPLVNPLGALLLGAVTWLFLRFELGRSARIEVEKYTELRRQFDDRKNSFLASP